MLKRISYKLYRLTFGKNFQNRSAAYAISHYWDQSLNTIADNIMQQRDYNYHIES